MPPVRLHKLLADAGVASRRAAERLIVAGRVRVNGVPVVELGAHADPARDSVEVDGRPVPRAEQKRYVLLHKPRGVLTTQVDPRGRPRVFDLVPELGVRLHSVGRLDFDAEGLLLLTNDGDLTYRLTHPRHGVRRIYHVLVQGQLDPSVLDTLQRGVVLGGRTRAGRAGAPPPDGGSRAPLGRVDPDRGAVPGGQAPLPRSRPRRAAPPAGRLRAARPGAAAAGAVAGADRRGGGAPVARRAEVTLPPRAVAEPALWSPAGPGAALRHE